MTPLLWGAIGIAVGAAALHGILGIRRPVDRARMSFAMMMAFLAAYFYFGLPHYQATSAEAAIEAVRRQVAVVLGCHACLLVFVPAYTNVKIPRIVMTAYWIGLAVMFVANLVAPYGLWYSGMPRLARSTLFGQPYHTVVAQPLSLLQYAYAVYFSSFLLLGLACAVRAFRGGDRLRSAMFAAALAIIVAAYLVDVIRESVGATWPYVGEIGFAAWALVMSVQLGHKFRAQSAALALAVSNVEMQAVRLRRILDALRTLERHIHAPIDRLALGVETLVPDTSTEEVLLRRLRRAVAKLRDCARAMPELGVPIISEKHDTAAV